MQFFTGRLFVFGVVLSFALMASVTAGCSSRSSPPTPGVPSATAANALAQVQQAIDAADGYTLDVQQTNFILPRWGGADSGEVQVSRHGASAKATLKRTGEQDATYAIFDVGTATYFQRSTCPQAFRISGDNVSVLAPYMLAGTLRITHAANASVDGSVIRATLAGLGPVVIQVDLHTHRPMVITGRNGSGPVVWTFKQWGNVQVRAPSPVAGERGPGGIPC